RWLLGMYLAVASLYVLTASLPLESIRHLIGAIWYADTRRIIAILPIVVLPIAVIGAQWLLERWRAKTQLKRFAMVAATFLIISSQLIGMNYARVSLWREYRMNAESDLITPDELKVFDYIAENLPKDAN